MRMDKKEYFKLLHMTHIHWYNAEVQYALDLMRELKRLGHENVFFTAASSLGANEARRAGFMTYEEAGFNAKGLLYVTAIPAVIRLMGILKSERPDAVILHRSEGMPLIVWACRRLGIPVIRVRGDMRPVRTMPLNRYIYTRCLDAVVASNHAIEKSLRERLGAPKRLRVIHGGVDRHRFTPFGAMSDFRSELGIPASTFLVGILGRLDRIKGHDDFIEAAKIVLQSGADAHFVVLAKEYSPLIRDLKTRTENDPVLRGRVGFLGYRDDLPAALRMFDLGVVASHGSEANCRVALEWMATGIPIVATKIGVLPDIVVDGVTGFLVEPYSPASMARKISSLLENPTLAYDMGQAARSRVVERFSIARCAERYLSLIEEIVGGHSPRKGVSREESTTLISSGQLSPSKSVFRLGNMTG